MGWRVFLYFNRRLSKRLILKEKETISSHDFAKLFIHKDVKITIYKLSLNKKNQCYLLCLLLPMPFLFCCCLDELNAFVCVLQYRIKIYFLFSSNNLQTFKTKVTNCVISLGDFFIANIKTEAKDLGYPNNNYY